MKKVTSFKSSSSKSPPLSDEDRLLWHHFTRDIKPLVAKKKPAIADTPDAKMKVLPLSTPPLTTMHPLTPREDLLYRGRRRLKRPTLHAHLDLHGLTQIQAQQQLERFILSSYEKGYSCVLIITGKGKRNPEAWWERTGVLRESVPRWLNAEPNRSHIITYAPARLEDGGSGSLYVYLKRK